MFLIVYSVIVSLAFGGALIWYLIGFMSDGFGLKGTQTDLTICIIAALMCGLNIIAVYHGWTIYFVVLALVIAIAQLLMLEERSKLVFYATIAGQIPAALVSIVSDIRHGQWNWCFWVFSLLLFPLMEIALYKLLSFISAENDRAQTDQDYDF